MESYVQKKVEKIPLLSVNAGPMYNKIFISLHKKTLRLEKKNKRRSYSINEIYIVKQRIR